MNKATLKVLLRIFGTITILVFIFTYILYLQPILERKAEEKRIIAEQVRLKAEQRAADSMRQVAEFARQEQEDRYYEEKWKQMKIEDSIYKAKNGFLALDKLAVGLTFNRAFDDLPREWEFDGETIGTLTSGGLERRKPIARFIVRQEGNGVCRVHLDYNGESTDDLQWKILEIERVTEEQLAQEAEESARRAANQAAVQERLQQGNAAYNNAVRQKARVDRINQQYNRAGVVRSYGEIYNDIKK